MERNVTPFRVVLFCCLVVVLLLLDSELGEEESATDAGT
jgi:hypothetical protein